MAASSDEVKPSEKLEWLRARQDRLDQDIDDAFAALKAA